jgi:hypothetical protein
MAMDERHLTGARIGKNAYINFSFKDGNNKLLLRSSCSNFFSPGQPVSRILCTQVALRR